MRGVSLSGMNLPGAILEEVDLSGMNLTHTNLSGAYLSGVNLSGATLTGATLTGATLAGATLAGATLAGAYLVDTNFSGADLRGVVIGLPEFALSVVDEKTRVDPSLLVEIQNLLRKDNGQLIMVVYESNVSHKIHSGNRLRVLLQEKLDILSRNDDNLEGGSVAPQPPNPISDDDGAAEALPVEEPNNASAESTDINVDTEENNAPELSFYLGNSTTTQGWFDALATPFFNGLFNIVTGDRSGEVETIVPDNFHVRVQVRTDKVYGSHDGDVTPSDVGIHLEGDNLIVPDTPEAALMLVALQHARAPNQTGTNIERTGIAFAVPEGASEEFQQAYTETHADLSRETARDAWDVIKLALLGLMRARAAQPSVTPATTPNGQLVTPNPLKEPKVEQTQPVRLNVDYNVPVNKPQPVRGQ